MKRKTLLARKLKKAGFTLIEILLVAGIFLFVVVSTMKGFMYFFDAKETAENKLKALLSIQDRIEEIRNDSFDDILAADGSMFSLTGVTGKGYVRVNPVVAADIELLELEVLACWESESGGRVIGEDKNFNGNLDVGEDDDSDGEIDSPLTMRTLITRH